MPLSYNDQRALDACNDPEFIPSDWEAIRCAKILLRRPAESRAYLLAEGETQYREHRHAQHVQTATYRALRSRPR